MAMEVKIKNLGKLTDATINIGRFTVFAGLNSTGKSFASKSLYSLFSAMNANHLEACFRLLIVKINSYFQGVRLSIPEETLLNEFLSRVADLDAAITNTPIEGADKFLAVEASLPSITQALKGVEESYNKMKPFMNEITACFSSADDSDTGFLMEINTHIENSINELIALKSEDSVSIVEKGTRHEISRNFVTNFQVPRIADLKRDKSKTIEFDVEGFGNVTINSGIKFKIKSGGLNHLQKYSNVMYLESPTYWVLKPVLDSHKRPFRMRQDSIYLDGIPQYFKDLSALMSTRYSGEPLFPDILAELEDTLNGKVRVADTRELVYQEKGGGSYPLNLAAMGIANLGVLAMLIERNLFDDDTFLFIDEPEVHLHPAWQRAMVKTLLRLSRGGVHVVMATHSPDILKYLEVELKKSEDLKGLLQLNHFTSDGVSATKYDSVLEKLYAIKEELTDSYYKLHLEELLL